MTPRERIIASLNHQKPDQVPIAMGCRPEVMENLRAHFAVQSDQEVAEIFSADMFRRVSCSYTWPEFEERLAKQTPGAFGSDENTNVIWRDERTFEDYWGVVQQYGSDGKYLEWMDGPLVKSDDIDSVPWPDESNLNVPDDLAARVAEFKRDGYWVSGGGQCHPFKRAWHMRGFENFLCDYMADPKWVEAIYDKLLAYNLPICRALARADVDMIEFWGDVAMQDRMIVPPERWRELDKKIWKTIIDETHKVNPNVKFFFHSDGNVTDIIDDIIDVGFDFLNPLQPECVNPAAIKAKWGSQIMLDGGGSVQRTLPRGSVDDVKREIDFLMTTCAYDGGFMLRASNVVPFDCPLENVIAFYELARDYDMSSLQGPPAVIPDQPPCMSVE